MWHLHISHNTLCLHPKILHNFCFQFLLGLGMTVVQREIWGHQEWHIDGRCANVDRICRKRELPQVWGWLWYPINLLSEITLFRFIVVRSSEWNFRSVYFDPFHLSVRSKTAHAYRKRSILFQKHKVWRIERFETRAQDSRPVQSNLLTDHFLLTIGDKGRKREMRNLKKRANKTIYPRNFWRRRKEIQVLERCR